MSEYIGLICLGGSVLAFALCLTLMTCRRPGGVALRYVSDGEHGAHRARMEPHARGPIVAVTIENFYPLGVGSMYSTSVYGSSMYSSSACASYIGNCRNASPAPSPGWSWLSSPSGASSVDIQYVPSDQILVAKL
jgi:hypothetical protein